VIVFLSLSPEPFGFVVVVADCGWS
jgi:hypothetical protein